MDMCLDLVDCYSALPKDPILRKQQLEELMMTSHSSFTFMQVRYGWMDTSGEHEFVFRMYSLAMIMRC